MRTSHLPSVLLVLLAMLLNTPAFRAQTEGVSIKTSPTAPHVTAMLDVESSTKGILIPRVNLTNTTSSSPMATTPATALLVYNLASNASVTPGFYYWNSGWRKLMTVGSELWSPDPATNGGIMRNGGTVTIGSTSLTTLPTTTLNVLGPAVFWTLSNVPSTSSSTIPLYPTGNTTGFGLHIGEPAHHQNVYGGHANEINFYGDALDLQWYSQQDVRVGAFGGSNLNVYKGGNCSRGNIMCEGGLTAYSYIYCVGNSCTGSDSTLKKDRSEMTNVLSKVLSMNTYEYHYKTESGGDKKHIGVIAQEVNLQFPQLVRTMTLSTTDFQGATEGKNTAATTTTNKLAVDYQGLSALLLQAIKEQQAQIESLKSRVTYLETH